MPVTPATRPRVNAEERQQYAEAAHRFSALSERQRQALDRLLTFYDEDIVRVVSHAPWGLQCSKPRSPRGHRHSSHGVLRAAKRVCLGDSVSTGSKHQTYESGAFLTLLRPPCPQLSEIIAVLGFGTLVHRLVWWCSYGTKSYLAYLGELVVPFVQVSALYDMLVQGHFDLQKPVTFRDPSAIQMLLDGGELPAPSNKRISLPSP